MDESPTVRKNGIKHVADFLHNLHVQTTTYNATREKTFTAEQLKLL